MKLVSSALVFLLVLAGCTQNNQKEVENPETVITLNAKSGVITGTADFGVFTHNATSTKLITFNLKNDGTEPLVGPGTIDLADQGFSISYTNCPASLAKQKSCSLKVVFEPRLVTPGAKSANLNFDTVFVNLIASKDAPPAPETITLVGQAQVQMGSAVVTSVDFGEIAQKDSVLKTLSIKNVGTGTLPIKNVVLSDANFSLSYDLCSGKALAKGSSCTIKVALSGANKEGNLSSSLSYGDLSVALTGKVITPASAAADPTSTLKANVQLMDGTSVAAASKNVGSFSGSQNIMINLSAKNTGTMASVASTAQLSDAVNFALSYNTCNNISLNISATCSVKITFGASGKTAGNYSTTLSFGGQSIVLNAVVTASLPTCASGTHLEGTTCVANARTCANLPTGATAGTETWSGSGTGYGACVVSACNAASYHLTGGSCVSNSRTCTTLPSGAATGSENWVSGGWSSCVIASCIPNHNLNNNVCEVQGNVLKNFSVSLLKDININNKGSSVGVLAKLGNNYLLGATTAATGAELYITDGTTAGTNLLKDLVPGPKDGIYSYMPTPIISGGKAYFVAYDPTNGSRELYKTDGTSSGTSMVKALSTSPGSTGFSGLGVDFNGELVFLGKGSIGDNSLWITDGTLNGTGEISVPAGTSISTSNGMNSTKLSPFGVHGNYVYFMASTASDGMELWRTDGETATLFKDLTPGSYVTSGYCEGGWGYESNEEECYMNGGWYFSPGGQTIVNSTGPMGFFNLNGTLYAFTVVTNYDPYGGGYNYIKMYKIDGTTTGTVAMYPNGDYYFTGGELEIADIKLVGGNLYFLNKFGGSYPQTYLVTFNGTDFAGDYSISGYGANRLLHIPNQNRFYFVSGYDLHFYDYTNGDNGQVSGVSINDNYSVTATDNYIYYLGYGAQTYYSAYQVYRTDGVTPGGIVGNYNGYKAPTTLSGISSESYSGMVALGDEVLFLSNFFAKGPELYKANSSGISLVKDINLAGADSSPGVILAKSGSTGFFIAKMSEQQSVVMKTDGTTNGTVQVSNDNQSDLGETINSTSVVVAGSYVYYNRSVSGSYFSVYAAPVSGGSSSLVFNSPSSYEGATGHLFVAGDSVCFRGAISDSVNGMGELFCSKNGAQATVVNLNGTSAGALPNFGTIVNAAGGKIYAFGITATYGTELMKYDPAVAQSNNGALCSTGANPCVVKDINAGTTSTQFNLYYNFGDKFVFLAYSPTYGYEYWVTDGTEAGTNVLDLTPGSQGTPDIYNLENKFTVIGNKALINYRTSNYGYTIYSTDGTMAGTTAIKDVEQYTHIPYNAVTIGNKYYFILSPQNQSQTLKSEIWETDGTASGTKKVMTSPFSSSRYAATITNLSAFKDSLIFTMRNESDVTKLYKHSGTIDSLAEELDENLPAVTNDSFLSMGILGDKMIIRSSNSTIGAEVFIIEEN